MTDRERKEAIAKHCANMINLAYAPYLEQARVWVSLGIAMAIVVPPMIFFLVWASVAG